MANLPSLLLTAGPTHEPIDAVRFIGNRSSGRMGLAIADAAATCDIPTTLLLGPTDTTAPVHSHIRLRRFRTTTDLRALLTEEWPSHDMLIMAAAVADFRPKTVLTDGKLSRGRSHTIELDPTPDLVAEAASRKRPGQVIVGFALEEPTDLVQAASQKLRDKGLDAIVANPLETMDAATIAGSLITSDGRWLRPQQGDGAIPKCEFATWLVDQTLALQRAKPQTGPTSTND